MEPPFANNLAPCNFISGDLTVFKPKYLSLQITIYATLLVSVKVYRRAGLEKLVFDQARARIL